MERDADSAVSYQGCRGKERDMERDADSAVSYQGCRGKERDMERDADGALFIRGEGKREIWRETPTALCFVSGSAVQQLWCIIL